MEEKKIVHKELSLIKLITQLWQKKIFIISITSIFTIVGVIFALSLPNKYQAEVMMIPAEDSQPGGLSALASQFGGLAGMAGLNLNSGSSKKYQIALQILKSRAFLNAFIKRHNIAVPVFASQGWDVKSDKLDINPKLYDEKNKVWVRKFKFPRTATPSEQELYDVFVKMVDVKIDSREGTYRVSVEFFSPNFAQQWANLLVNDINDHMRNEEISLANGSIKFLREQVASTKVSSAEAVFFGLIEEQTKKAMLAQVQKDYVFSVIDPAIAPEKKSSPKRAIICIFFVILGGLFSCALVLIRNYRSLNNSN
jgi:LPS O-antigen subunit length determinant protein (WzzB/FepE family)